MEGPLVSVVMPVYNAERYVAESIASILEQSYAWLELIIVNDGSTDGSDAAIRRFDDPRIVYRIQPNQGVSHALNAALALARGTYVARQDADDRSLPDRLARQVAHLEAHPACGIIGTFAQAIAPDGRPLHAMDHYATDDARIQYRLVFDSEFASSSVTFRRALLADTGGFDASRQVWDDYDMWCRLAHRCEAANIPEPLLLYRVLESGLTGTTTNARQLVHEQRRRNIRHYWPELPAERIEVLARIGNEHAVITTAQLRQAQRDLHGLIRRLSDSTALLKELDADAHARLMSYRVVQHHTLAHRALDKGWKTAVLAANERTLHAT